MIKLFKRNVFDGLGDRFILAHGCNMRGVMGAGVALAIKNKWPDCFEAYRDLLPEHNLGETIWFRVGKGQYVANCLTQASTGTGLQVDYEAIRESFDDVLYNAQVCNYTHVDTVPIGMGLGGGDPAIIMPMLSKLSERHGIDIHMSVFDQETYDMLQNYV